MKVRLLICFLTLHQFIFAQDDNPFPDMRSWMLNNGDTTDRYIFADTAFVRTGPGTKQAILDTLFTGHNVTVTGVTSNALTIRGLTGPWLQVRYTKNDEQKTGYVWQGMVSCMPLRRGDTKFIYAITGRTSKDFKVQLKAVQNGQIVATASLTTPNDESANYSFSKVMSGMGLTNVQNVVVVTFGGEACGIPLYENCFAFTKSGKFIRLPEKMTVSDAGIFYHVENFTFPNEKNGKPDMVIWNMESAESIEKVDAEGNPIFKITEKKTDYYTWDGANETITKIKK